MTFARLQMSAAPRKNVHTEVFGNSAISEVRQSVVGRDVVLMDRHGSVRPRTNERFQHELMDVPNFL